MGTALVIILPPVINRFPAMKNIAEPVFIQTLLREIIHTGQALDPPTVGQCVHNEIHRPCQVRRIRVQKRKPFGASPLRRRLRFTLSPLRW